MEQGEIKRLEIPGLNTGLRVQDLEQSCRIYNRLPTDSQQPEISDLHVRNIAEIFIRNRAERVLGIHLAHAHYVAPENTALIGTNYHEPYCRWARPIDIKTVDLDNVHGHVFVLTDEGFHPYEYQIGPPPDLSGVSNTFLPELADYLKRNKLSFILGLQAIDECSVNMLELVLPLATIMLDISCLNGCTPTRQTGWKFEIDDGEPRVCKANETHGRHANGHDIFNAGAPYPKLDTFEDVIIALVQKNILLK